MPYYEYDHTYYDRPPRPYNPRPSSCSPYHFEDLYAALPGDVVWSTTYPAHMDRDVPPFTDPHSSDRESPPSENRKRCEKKRGSQLPQGGSGKAGRDATDRSKQTNNTLTITRQSPPSTNPQAAIRLRERRLVERRLLLSQMHGQLETAYNVYNKVVGDFQDQTVNVKTFANADTLDRIWADMVTSEMKQREANTERPADFDSAITQVGLCLRHLQSAEKDKLPSVLGLHEKNIMIERQFKNVITAVEEIVELAVRAHVDHLACGDLVWYLNRAWTLADPESVVWKGLLGKLPAAGQA